MRLAGREDEESRENVKFIGKDGNEKGRGGKIIFHTDGAVSEINSFSRRRDDSNRNAVNMLASPR